METLRKVEQIILRIRLDGYPIGPDWMSGGGWKVAFDTVTTVLVLMALVLAVVGMYAVMVRALVWIADLVG